MGHQLFSKAEKGRRPKIHLDMTGQIEAAVNDDPENFIVDGMEDNYAFILSHQIRELIRLWDRSYDESRETLISGTTVVFPLKIL